MILQTIWQMLTPLDCRHETIHGTRCWQPVLQSRHRQAHTHKYKHTKHSTTVGTIAQRIHNNSLSAFSSCTLFSFKITILTRK